MRNHFLLSLLLFLGLCSSRLLGQGEFDPGGYNSLRIENEYKLAVPREIQDSVWAYLQANYLKPEPFLWSIDSSFHAQFAVDIFLDQYFDTPDFALAKLKSGVRHRSRDVLGPNNSRKDGRQLMQIKINGISENELNRGEYKYPIMWYKSFGKTETEDFHPFIGRIKRDHRKDAIDRVAEMGIDAHDLEPTIEIRQRRKRVYVFSDTTAFATLTLDIDTAFYLGDTALFTEMEMELNEISYTVANDSVRAIMEAKNDRFKADLLGRFPSIRQDQTPKYNKAAKIFGIDPTNGSYGKWHLNRKTQSYMIYGLLLFGLPLSLGLLLWWRKRKARREFQHYMAWAAQQRAAGGW